MALRRDLAMARRGAIVSCVGGLRELGREDVGRQDLGCCAEEVLVGHQGCDDGTVGVGVASGLVGECIEDPEGVGVGPDREPDNRSCFFVGECDSAGEQTRIFEQGGGFDGSILERLSCAGTGHPR